MFQWFRRLLAILLIVALLIVTGLIWPAVILFGIYLLIEGIYKIYLMVRQGGADRDDGRR